MLRNSGAWFSVDEHVDAAIRAHFQHLIPKAAQGVLAHWEETPRGALALVLILDQFTRNCFRGAAEAFAYDPAAKEVACRAVERGHHRALPFPMSCFFLPFGHSERLLDVVHAVGLFKEAVPRCADGVVRKFAEEGTWFAEEHCRVVGRFGLYPHRNTALGRASTPDELDFIASHVGF